MEKLLLIIFIFLLSPISYAAPKVGKSAAARYFQKSGEDDVYRARKPSQINSENSGNEQNRQTDHYLTFGISNFASSEAYGWGDNAIDGHNSGKWGVDVSYRISQDEYLFDQAVRFSFNQYDLGTTINKLSFMYSITFPESETRFPLYFGAAAGPGLFLKQLPQESVISLDYQLFFGLRLFNVFDQTGFYVEGGLKNHILLLSDGQFNGSYVALGAVFLF